MLHSFMKAVPCKVRIKEFHVNGDSSPKILFTVDIALSPEHYKTFLAMGKILENKVNGKKYP